MAVTNEFERDLVNQSHLKHPGRVDMIVFQNIPDVGDGSPGIQRCFRNYLHEGGMEKDLDLNSYDIKNVNDIVITGEIVFPSATIHSSGTEIHMHPNIGNADGNLIIHPNGSNIETHIHLRNNNTANYGDFRIQINGSTVGLQGGQGGSGSVPDTLNLTDACWGNINIGDASTIISMNAITITAAEFGQIANINATTISATQWGYLGELDQPLKQADSPTFVGLTLSSDLITTSTIDGVDVSIIKLNSMPSDADGDINCNSQKLTSIGTPTDNTDAARLQDIKLATTSTIVQHTNNTSRTTTSLTPEKVKEIIIYRNLKDFTVRWEQRSGSFGDNCWMQVYINGSPVGVAKLTIDTPWVEQFDNISNIYIGDLLQMYGYVNTGAGSIRNMEIRYEFFTNNDP